MADLNGSYNGLVTSVYSGADVTLLQRRIVGTYSGYNFYNDIDSLILSDVNYNGSLTGSDTTLLQNRIVTPAGTAYLPKIPTPPVVTASQAADLIQFVTLTNVNSSTQPQVAPVTAVSAPAVITTPPRSR